MPLCGQTNRPYGYGVKTAKKKNGEEGESGLSCDAEKEVEKNEVGEGKCTQMNEKY